MKRFIALLIVLAFSAFATDELYVIVKVKSYNQKTGELEVVGVSSPCESYTMKLLIDPGQYKQNMVEKEMGVMINSPTCRDGGVYKIIGGLP